MLSFLQNCAIRKGNMDAAVYTSRHYFLFVEALSQALTQHALIEQLKIGCMRKCWQA